MSFALSLNTGTTPTLNLREAVQLSAEAGLTHIGPWRHLISDVGGAAEAAKIITDGGLKASTLCRGGFLTANSKQGQAAALEANREAIREAGIIGADELIMVVGGLPAAAHVLGGEGERSDKNIASARERVARTLDDLVPYALEHGVRLVLEALHPMYVADRAVLSTLGQALDLATPYPTAAVGVVVDTFHVFWDPQLQQQIQRAGLENRLASYQICDFNLPLANDALKSRGMMGDGYVDFETISRWVSKAGYRGPVEVEIFNEQINSQPPAQTLATMAERYTELVLPHLNEAAGIVPADVAL
ncbi:sugar phosphate isomerase/epimerase family protein [Arthrobacter sp. MYb213]|uniref:sugar phosphate isomerase/epimerase family protein n=1 Tax=Arthrobacter sp. MYb213 TaxID=1848595 RepID=UPI000CFC63E0|nr:sugar phosphate isomerase/epimerase family protein [Arthrobacter sp. MYb213]PRB70073.1 xylose isomerase [Arthrobacter sp. MYb213]